MEEITSFISKLVLPKLGFTDLVEMLLIAFVLYHLLLWVKNTRTWFLLKGLIVLLGFFGIAALLNLNTILFLAQKSLTMIVLAMIVVFQPELRKALEHLGKGNWIINLFFASPDALDGTFDDKIVEELVKASFTLGKTRTGALIVIERELPLEEYIRTGIQVDAVLTSQLLINIFEHNTPLHDGAVVVRGDRVMAATCYLPLSYSSEISKDLGTRHRAALGVSESTDSMTIIVSEESGRVSVASGGKLSLNLTSEQLQEHLNELKRPEIPKSHRPKWWKGRRKNEKMADK